ncbi:MAG: hypothetical protein ACPGWR_13830 [Ardenticatenaceae bacterium]
MRRDKRRNIKEELNKAMARWWGRKGAIKSIIAKATDAQKQEILEDAALLARLDSKLRRDEMRTALNDLNASIYHKIQVMHRWEGRYLPIRCRAEIMSLLESASEAQKRRIANNTIRPFSATS